MHFEVLTEFAKSYRLAGKGDVENIHGYKDLLCSSLFAAEFRTTMIKEQGTHIFFFVSSQARQQKDFCYSVLQNKIYQ